MSIEEAGDLYCECSFDGLIDLIGRKWAILLIAMIGEKKVMRFNDIYRSLKGISPSTLSSLLSHLSKNNILERRVYDETPLKVEYSLTESGKQLNSTLASLIKWISKNETFTCSTEGCDSDKFLKLKVKAT